MADQVNPRYLLGPEIDYELKLRGVISNRDRNEKIKVLRRILDKEAQGAKNLGIQEFTFEFADEHREIEATLSSIGSLVADFEGNPADSLFLRIKFRLAHVMARIHRIVVPEDNTKSTVEKYKHESFVQCLALEADAYEKVDFLQGTQAHASVVNLNSTLAQPVVNVGSPSSSCANIRNFIPEWNLKFNGDPKKVYDFLERVSELATAYDVTEDQLFKSATLLFSDEGLIWFRNAKNSVSSWGELSQQIKKDFLSPTCDDDVWDQIKSRKQRRFEAISIFVSQLENLFARLSRAPSEASRIKYIKQNLLPEYFTALALHDITTVTQLITLVKKLEEANLVKNKQHQKNQVSSHDHFPRDGPRSSSWNKPAVSKNQTPNPSNETQHRPPNASERKCWNCGRPGHLYSDCRSQKRKFCFRCGKKDVTTKTCSTCRPKN